MPGTHHAGCGCEAEIVGAAFLLRYINLDAVDCLNEEVPQSGRTIFKDYEKRLDESAVCRSDNPDTELLFHIPFVGPTKISGLHCIGGEGGRSPRKVRVFRDEPTLDFSNIDETPPIQEIDLQQDFHGSLEYPLKVTKLLNVSALALHFSVPYDPSSDCIEMFYLGLRGESSGLKQQAVVTVYESRPNVADHKTPDEASVPFFGI